MDKLAFPDPNRAHRLTEELTSFLADLPYVERILLFGSRARHTADRWSDIDVVVVTRSTSDSWLLYKALGNSRPILYHHPLTPHVEPCGGNLLGAVFFGESVFPEAIKRFGEFHELYVCDPHNLAIPTVTGETQSPICHDPVTPDEERIGIALHWAKKAVKKFLRGTGSQAELLQTSNTLKQVLQDFPNGLPLPNGDICQLAQTYLNIAGDLLML
jgi:Nucleotidyltransferase domain